MMIGVYNHLLSKVFRFHTPSGIAIIQLMEGQKVAIKITSTSGQETHLYFHGYILKQCHGDMEKYLKRGDIRIY